MRTRLSFLVVVVSLLLPAEARASGHWYSAAATPSAHTGLSKLWGGSLSAEKALKNKSRGTAFVDFGVHAGAHETSTLTQYSLLGGVRYALPRLKKSVNNETRYALDLFVHPLFGRIWTKDTAANSDEGDWAAGIGIGADYLFSKYGGLRGQLDHVSFWREQGRDSFVRISLGIVYRFEHD